MQDFEDIIAQNFTVGDETAMMERAADFETFWQQVGQDWTQRDILVAFARARGVRTIVRDAVRGYRQAKGSK